MEEVCGFLSASRSNTKSQILPDLPRRLEPPRQRVARRGSRITQKNIQQPAYPRRCRCGLNGGSPRCRCGFLQPKRLHAKSQTLPDLPRRLGAPRQRVLRRGSEIKPKKSISSSSSHITCLPASQVSSSLAHGLSLRLAPVAAKRSQRRRGQYFQHKYYLCISKILYLIGDFVWFTGTTQSLHLNTQKKPFAHFTACSATDIITALRRHKHSGILTPESPIRN